MASICVSLRVRCRVGVTARVTARVETYMSLHVLECIHPLCCTSLGNNRFSMRINRIVCGLF
jgi:hypothetical protein